LQDALVSKHRRRFRKSSSYRPQLMLLETREAPFNMMSLASVTGGVAALNIFAVPSESGSASGGSAASSSSFDVPHELQPSVSAGGQAEQSAAASSFQSSAPAAFAAFAIDSGEASNANASTTDWFQTGALLANPIGDPLQPQVETPHLFGGVQQLTTVAPEPGGGGGGGGDGCLPSRNVCRFC
jgi:hypothetical protein